MKWDLRCHSCGVNAGITGETRNEDMMSHLVKKASVLADLAFSPSEARTHLMFLEIDDNRVPLNFFADHRGHLVKPVDENGRGPVDVFDRAIW
jgi:hypothetical protein